MTEKKQKKMGIKELTKGFWELSRPRQEAFLRNLYDLSSENKALFKLRLGNDNSVVFESLKKEIYKETINRIGKYRKLRLAAINKILRNADKYALPMLQQVDLKREVWMGMLEFLTSKRYFPDRYQIACARHLEQYLKMVKHHILEKSEVEEILEKDRELLVMIINKGFYLPYIKDVCVNFF